MAEKEYIEREAVMQKFADHVKRSNNSDFAPVPTWNQAVQIVEDFPAADVRPVVTCGECKHWFENGSDYCSCDRDALLRERDFFCAAGEKREES